MWIGAGTGRASWMLRVGITVATTIRRSSLKLVQEISYRLQSRCEQLRPQVVSAAEPKLEGDEQGVGPAAWRHTQGVSRPAPQVYSWTTANQLVR
jgi:hypothetical protein